MSHLEQHYSGTNHMALIASLRSKEQRTGTQEYRKLIESLLQRYKVTLLDVDAFIAAVNRSK